MGSGTLLGIMTWTILSAGGAVRKFVCFHPGCKSAAKTTTAETVKFVQAAWSLLVVTMVTATMVSLVQEDVGATMASKEEPANCVSAAITDPTAQLAAAGGREGVTTALKGLDSVPVIQAGQVISARRK